MGGGRCRDANGAGPRLWAVERDITAFPRLTRRHSTLGMLPPARYEEENGSLEQLKINYND